MKIYKVILVHVFVIFIFTTTFSQIGIGTTNPDTFTILDITEPVKPFNH